jgi:hypothetical protein
MRRPAVVVAVAVLVAGLAATAPGYLTDQRDYVAVTPQAPTAGIATPFALPGHARACMDLVALDRHSEQARLQASTPDGSAMPLELTVTGPGYRTQGRVPARYADGETVAVAVRPPRRSLIATVCVRNLGGRMVLLGGVHDRSRSRSTVLVNGAPSEVGFVLTFYERRPTSILSRLPVSLQRMDVLRPGVIGPAALWLLLALFVAGMPAAAVWAFARALRADEAAEAEAEQPA